MERHFYSNKYQGRNCQIYGNGHELWGKTSWIEKVKGDSGIEKFNSTTEEIQKKFTNIREQLKLQALTVKNNVLRKEVYKIESE